MIKSIYICLVFAAAVVPFCAQASSPMQTVEDNVNQLIAVLGDESLSNEAGQEMKIESIRAISDDLFDFYALARRTLGSNWNKFNANQQKQFIVLYRRLLESIYMDRLLQYQGEEVKFIKEISLNEKRAEVHSAIVSAKGVVPINYKMYLKNGVWKTYDLIVANDSLVANYRSQFNSLLATETPEKIIAMIREKVRDYS